MRKTRSPMKTVAFSANKKLFVKLERFRDGIRLSRSAILTAAVDYFLQKEPQEQEEILKRYLNPREK